MHIFYAAEINDKSPMNKRTTANSQKTDRCDNVPYKFRFFGESKVGLSEAVFEKPLEAVRPMFGKR